jgi:hypothetical protein
MVHLVGGWAAGRRYSGLDRLAGKPVTMRFIRERGQACIDNIAAFAGFFGE